jgi:thiamine transport system permease protein
VRRPPLYLIFPLLFLAVFFVLPLGRTLGAALDNSAWQWVASPYASGRMAGAVLQATLSTVVTLALAIPLAWHHHHVQLPWSQAHLAIHAAPFVLPVFVVVGGVRELFGPNGWISALLGQDLLAAMGPLAAIVVAHAIYNYGFAARLLHVTLERRPWRLEEAAQVLGASPWSTRMRVLVPLLAPGFLSVALLVWVFSFASFGVVLLLGSGAWSTPETLIYQNLAGAFPQASRAAAIGAIQLALNVLLLTGYFLLLRRARSVPRDPIPRKLRASLTDRTVQAAALALGVLPVLAVLIGAFRVQGNWSMEAWRAILDNSHPAHLAGFELAPVLLRTIGYAISSAAVSLTLALLLGQGLQRAGRLRGMAEILAAVPLGTSSVLLGLGYILTFGAGSLLDLRGQWLAIVVIHALIGFPFVARTLLPAMQQHDERMDEVAASLGASPRHVLWRVQWPMLRAPILAATGFAVAMSIGDFGASLLLMQRDTMGLVVWIGEHDRPFDALLQAQSVVLTAILAVMAAGAYMLVERFRGPEGT